MFNLCSMCRGINRVPRDQVQFELRIGQSTPFANRAVAQLRFLRFYDLGAALANERRDFACRDGGVFSRDLRMEPVDEIRYERRTKYS